MSSAITFIPLFLPFYRVSIMDYTLANYCLYSFSSRRKSCYLRSRRLTLLSESRYLSLISFISSWLVMLLYQLSTLFYIQQLILYISQSHINLMLKIFIQILTNRSLLIPNFRLNHVSQIVNSSELMNEKKQVYIFDKDDTLVHLHQFQIKSTGTVRLLSELKEKGKQVYVVSNSVRDQGHKMKYINSKKRTEKEETSEQTLQVMHTQKKKPFNGQQIVQNIQNSPTNSAQSYKLRPERTIIVGDRLLTDIVLGNKMGWTTVLVKPVEVTNVKKHGIGVYVMRKIQNMILQFI